ncbi:MAG: tetratricopeptide repeat protein, partial [Prochloraceae cyanobacterium]
LNSQLARAYYQRAIIFGELGKYSQAYEDFQQAAAIAKSQKNTDLFKKAKKAQAQLKKLNQSNPLASRIFFGLKILLLTLFLSAAIGQITSNFNSTNDSEIHQREQE